MSQRIYIAGPMTGLPGLNFAAFHAQAATLRKLGYWVINPAEVNPDQTMAWAACMRRDIAELVTCDAIKLLPGWQQSKGATLEHHLAERLELAIYHPDDTPPRLRVRAPDHIPAKPGYQRNYGNRHIIASAGIAC